jgi:ubiquinone/menaquinone biosynthesis C-methylase UbiE
MENFSKALDAEQWGGMFNPGKLEGLLREATTPALQSAWTAEMLRLAKPGDRTLEIGSGSGQTSLCLAKAGCAATALDFSESALQLAASAARALSVELRTVLHNAHEELPFEENEFDVIFHAGLLEHFDVAERVRLLRLWRPYGAKMVSMVPNAASLCYRLGKESLEKSGAWGWGKEIPAYTQIAEFTAAGYTVTREYTIGAQAALYFMEQGPLKETLSQLWEERRRQGLEDIFHQGYLLVTIGV